MKLLIFLLLFCLLCGDVFAVDVPKLADAIKKSENSYKHPYGILKPYCKPGDPDGQCRKGCEQTIKKWMKRFKYVNDADFIQQFGQIYCPIGSDTDNGTCRFWVKNVSYFYNHPELINKEEV